MRSPRLVVTVLATTSVLLAAPAAGLAIDVAQIPVTVSPAPAKFKRGSTMKVQFNAPYNLGALSVAETYRLNVLPPARSKCREAVEYETAPDRVGDLVTMRVTPADVKPKGKSARWCEGTYRIQLTFEDPTESAPTGPPEEDESGPPEEVTPDDKGFGVDEYRIFERTFKVRKQS
jgi:hypothetical protein